VGYILFISDTRDRIHDWSAGEVQSHIALRPDMPRGAVLVTADEHSRRTLSEQADGASAMPDKVEQGQTALITQRSQVKILPPLPGQEAGSEQGSGLLRVKSYCQVMLGFLSHKQNVGFPAALHPES
jgi:hypothetical protein